MNYVCRWMLWYHIARKAIMLALERVLMHIRALQKTWLPSITAWMGMLFYMLQLLRFEAVSPLLYYIDHVLIWITSFFSTRKLRGTLNFDDVDVGLVSDSMVANSLYLQNGSCASSSGAPLKSEQPDCWFNGHTVPFCKFLFFSHFFTYLIYTCLAYDGVLCERRVIVEWLPPPPCAYVS